AREAKQVQILLTEMRAVTDKKIAQALTLQLGRDRNFLAQFASFLDSLRDIADTEDPDDLDAEDEDEADDARTKLAVAAARYRRFARSQARASVRRRRFRRGSNNEKIGQWLGDRGLATGVLADVGASLLVQGHARRIATPVSRFLNGMARRYREYRRTRQSEG